MDWNWPKEIRASTLENHLVKNCKKPDFRIWMDSGVKQAFQGSRRDKLGHGVGQEEKICHSPLHLDSVEIPIVWSRTVMH